MIAMKKIVLSMIVAAAALVGCQKSEELTVSTGDKIQLTASASLPTEGRAIISKDENGVYRSRWAENEYLYLVMDCELASGAYLSTSMVRENEGETASFSFTVDEFEASSYTYIATTAPVGIATRALFVHLADEQDQYYKGGSYDAAYDVLLSKAVVMDAQPATEGLRFSMQRLNGALKLNVKNLALAAGEEVESITFACEQPIVGEVKVTFDDLAAGTYPIPFEVEAGKTAVKTSINNTTGNFEVFYSCLPATLKAGESYIVTVKTNKATYHKVATLPADMIIEPNEITSVTVNMGDAASKSNVDTMSEEYTYAIGYTKDGVTYLLNRSAVTRNPAGAELSTLGLSLDAKGSISGAVPEAYVWNFEKGADGKVKFYYMTGSGNKAHLIGGNKNQGVAIQSKNADGVYVGYYFKDGVTYDDAFVVEEKEGGYCLNVAGNRWLDYNGTAFVANTKEGASGVVNFYRIKPAQIQKSRYPVITKAADVTEGTYVLMFKDASGNYFTMKNEMTLVAPAAVPISEIGLTMVDGYVTEANVADDYKWTFVTNDEGNLNIKPANNHMRFLREKNNGSGFAIVTKDEYDAAKEAGTITGVYEAGWKFSNHATYGLQAVAGANQRHMGVSGTAWAGYKDSGICGGLVLVKLSHSTEQL